MREGTRTALLEEGQLDEESVKRAVALALEAPPEDRVRAGLEVLIGIAEADPTAARAALRKLREDHARLARIEAWLGGEAERATFGLGAAIQVADAELASPVPDLHRLLPELLGWLEGDW